MLVGVLFGGRCQREYPGFSRFSDGQFFEADIPVPSYVERALDLTKSVWSQKSDIPTVVIDNEGHGENRGIVFMHGVADYDSSPDFVRSELITRVSIGEIDHEKRHLDFRNPSRVHIGVYGMRQFFPNDWRIVLRDKESPSIAYVREEVNLSLRWINGKLDSWDDFSQWRGPGEELKLGSKKFNEGRTNYSSSEIDYLDRDNSTQRLEEIYAKKFIRKEGRKRIVLPINQNLPSARVANEVLKHYFGSRETIPNVGYRDIHSDKLGIERLYRPDGISIDEGINFMFGTQLPRIRQFIERKE